MAQQVYVFDATLDDDPGVRRTVAVRSDQTLVDLHVVLRKAFGWHGDFPYTFRLGGARYTSPLTAEAGEATADVELDRLGLDREASIVHQIEAHEVWRIVVAGRPVAGRRRVASASDRATERCSARTGVRPRRRRLDPADLLAAARVAALPEPRPI